MTYAAPRRPFVAALVAVDEEALLAWAEANGKDGVNLEDLIDDPDLATSVQTAIDEANKAASRSESIRTLRILPHDLTIENGALTPTLKVKRSVVLEEYADVVDEIYT